jgi:CubicO group peptidase (beta-lactamase class C family)
MRALAVVCSFSAVASLTAQTVQYPEPRFAAPNRATTLAQAFETIPKRMTQVRDGLHAPGLSWGIVVDGEVAASGGVGVARTPDGPAVTPDTVFRIASMTKSFTALAILKLRDDGRLNLDDPAANYIPELARMPLPTRDAPAITVRHLLTHSAGFPEDNPWGDRQLAQTDKTLHDWIAKGLPFSTSPATNFEYANYGFALLGQIVGKASGLPYREFVSTRILQPLGMTSTYWDERDAPAALLARGSRYADGRWEDEPLLGDGAFGAMGGLFTSGRDLGRYVAFMLSAWPPRDAEDKGPVRRSSLREMQQGQRLAGFGATRTAPDAPLTASTHAYGFGLGATQDCRTRFTVAHSGGLPGFGSIMLWLPEHGVGVYAMANVTYAGAGRAARAMIEELTATGGLLPRQVPASRALVDVRAAIASLVNDWRDETLTKVAADNLLLDKTLADRRSEVKALRARVGVCRPDGDIRSENWLRGEFRLGCDHGFVTVTVTLAPTNPPTVQYLDFEEGHPLEPSLRTTVERLSKPTAAVGAAEWIAPSVERGALTHQLDALGSSYGTCTIGDPLGGNGRTEARVPLRCERGTIDLLVHTDADGRLNSARFVQPRDTPCVP